MTDLDIYFMKCEIAYLKKRISELEDGTVYSGLITEIAKLRSELSDAKADSTKLEDIRRILA